MASAHFTEDIQSVLITGFKSLPRLPGVKGFIAAYTGPRALDATLTQVNCTLKVYVIFALSAPGQTQMWTVNTAN